MSKLFREYGLILILILVGIVGYLTLRGNEQNSLAHSLDGIRNRLVAMVDDVASREAIAAHFDRFKSKVLGQEVSPEEVESMAANVLNLSNSGSTITPEEAELMLDMASSAPEVTLLPTPEAPEPGVPDPTPLVPAPPAPPTPLVSPTPAVLPTLRDLSDLGERLETMLIFNVEIEKVMDEHRDHREEMARHIRYRVEEGLHVVLDMAMTDEMKQRIGREAERLEARMRVVWKQNMAEETRMERERARRELRSVVALRKRPSREVRVRVGTPVWVVLSNLESLESLKHLEAMGYRAMLSDSIKHEIMVHLEVALEAAHEHIEEAMEATDESLEEQMEALEEYLEELEEALEELEEEMEEQRQERKERQEDNDNDDDEE